MSTESIGVAPGLSDKANSFIGLGAFETMGTDVGRMATGISYLEETISVQEDEYQAEADERKKAIKALGLVQSRLQVGRQHHQQQDPQEAIKHYLRALVLVEEAIRIREKQGENAPKKALEFARFTLTEVCSSLGVAYNDVGRSEDALSMHQRALSIRQETVGDGHPAVAECYNNVGALHFAVGDLQDAVDHYNKAHKLLVAAHGGKEEGAYIALTLYNIGVCHSGLGHAEQAQTALRQALKVAESALGSEHPKVDMIKTTLVKGAAVKQSA